MERINKSRSAFFSHGELGAFHGLLNPLSSRSLIECCIIPVLMYGSESWVLNSTLLSKLESFQAELGKRILKLPNYTSNTIPLLALDWPSMCSRILCSKLAFLNSVLTDNPTQSLRSRVFNSIAASDVMSMSIVKQCKFLEEKLDSNSNFTDEVLSQSPVQIRDLKKRILGHDRERTLIFSEKHPSLQHPLSIAKQKAWMKFWDTALDHGVNATNSALNALKLLSMTLFEDRICPVTECDNAVPQNTPLCAHFIQNHTNLPTGVTPDFLVDLIVSIGNDPDQFHDLTRISSSIARYFPSIFVGVYLYIIILFSFGVVLLPLGVLYETFELFF